MPRWKRAIDIVGAAVLLALLSPVFLLIALWIRCVSKGPVTFNQVRLGAMGDPFIIYKFRTMDVCDSDVATSDHRTYIAGLADSDEAVAKPDLSSRLILGGKRLRAWSLDELPQLFNVLQGNMSLVGPRPEVLTWEDYRPWQRRRFEVTPGITGLWQVSGKNRLTFAEMIDLDIRYVDERSVWLDLKIILKTFPVIFFKHNS
jgi:lipopolysaccharide/colanic/teichoic acid biosynthesis glycosyltransferase